MSNNKVNFFEKGPQNFTPTNLLTGTVTGLICGGIIGVISNRTAGLPFLHKPGRLAATAIGIGYFGYLWATAEHHYYGKYLEKMAGLESRAQALSQDEE
ncbi:hypothetical protein H696_00583 [Fonticula alba]|uniref:Uncharacterized protein n=1 Tax=Fonticula alba TaxID=691883 RepID=A0A058ZF74_FONAL|nr:hypothetical protein H696_00583 [Fonticula alba]KCV73035.1 hypothetical protein H696_00583 [Fonticula alba]|eukprot:XP_009492736.1 hypothetical protein H696_00583 [Fonticula alba]